jgi:hypothetical protein
MHHRSVIGSMMRSASAPNGTEIAAAIDIGATSRHVQWLKARTAKGAVPNVSIRSSVTAAKRGL